MVIVWLAPIVLLAKEDLGTAIPMIPMLLGLLILAGASLKLIVSVCLAGAACATAGVIAILQMGSSSYMARRLLAWLKPEDYLLTEAFQTQRALRSIGSGQWTGKGYAGGDQNLLGWVPEKHTDMIFSVVGEELGFLGSVVISSAFSPLASWVCGLPYPPAIALAA